MEQEAWKKSSRSGGCCGIRQGHWGGSVVLFGPEGSPGSFSRVPLLLLLVSLLPLGMLSWVELRFYKLAMGKLSQLEVTQRPSAPKLQTLPKSRRTFSLVKPNL